MVIDEINDVYVPVRADQYTKAEWMGRDKYVIDGNEYNECDFCRASCPSRELFKEPDSGLPLKCDIREDEMEFNGARAAWMIDLFVTETLGLKKVA